MRKMLVLFILLPIILFGQSEESLNAFKKSIPDNLGRPIKLPERSYNQNYNLDDSADYRMKKRVFIISSDSVYHLIFHNYHHTLESLKQFIWSDNDSSWYKIMFRYLADSLPVIDFSRQELVLYSACGQCLAFCSPHGNRSCHRNVCTFMDAWFLRDKQPLFVKKE